MTDISAAMKQMRNLLASVGLAWDRMTDREGSQEKLFENTAQAIEALTEQLNGFVETVPKDIEQLVQDQLQRQTAPDNLARQIHLLRNEIEEFKQHFEINSSQIPPESQRGVVVRALRSLFGGNGRQT
jgi:hypothetical protein